MKCTKCEGGIILPDNIAEVLAKKENESWEAWVKRITYFANVECFCECVEGQRIRFFHKKVDQLYKKKHKQNTNGG